MNSFYLRIFFIALIFLFVCKKEDWREKANAEIIKPEILHKDILSQKKDDFTLIGGFESKEKVIENWLKAMRQNPSTYDVDQYLLTDAEYKTLFLPHTIGSGTSLDTTDMATYWSIFLSRKSQGLEKIHNSLSGKNVELVNIFWRDALRTYGPWSAWKIDSIKLRRKGETENISLESIKLVACYKTKCKVAVVAP